MTDLSEQYGPAYPDLGATVAKLRRVAANHSIAAFKRLAVREHGRAVLKAIAGKQRAELAREGTAAPAPYTGTNRQIGLKILASIAKSARQTCNPDAIRKARTDAELIEAYEAAMAAKRKRQN